MTFDLGVSLLTPLTIGGSHIASMTRVSLKSIMACEKYSQMLTFVLQTTEDNGQPQRGALIWSFGTELFANFEAICKKNSTLS